MSILVTRRCSFSIFRHKHSLLTLLIKNHIGIPILDGKGLRKPKSSGKQEVRST